MAFIDDIVKFHSFSKSTVRTGLTLGEAVNPSGHTVTSKQVRSDDIPWFVNSFQGDEAKARTWAAANATAARHNDILYYGAEFKVGFTAPKCLIYVSKHEVDGKLVDLPADQCGWQTFDLNSATTLKNAAGKDVIAIHKNAKVEYVDGNNNAATNSNQQSLFVRRADGTLLDHFVAATDQIVGGQPSLGYNAVVSVSGKAIDEGEGSGNYIGNTYAGIVHFHAARSESKDTDGSVKGITVTCFEYIGDKLDTTIGNIREEIQDIVGVTMEGVVASVGTNDAATSAGIGVDSSSKTSPKITFTAGSVTTGETKLVSGGAVKTYVDTTALAEGGSIAKYIENYVSTNAKVTLTADTADGKTGITITPNGQESTSFTIGIDQTKIATKQSVDELSGLVSGLPATIQAAQDAADDAMTEAQAKVASVTLGTVPTGVGLGTDVKNPVLTIETAASSESVGNGSGDWSKLVTGGVAAGLAQHYGNLAEAAAVDTVKGLSLGSLASSTQGSYVSVTTSGTIGTGLTVNVNDSNLANTVSAASTAVQSVKVNGAALSKDASNAVDITALTAIDTTGNGSNGISLGETTSKKVTLTVTPATYTNKTWGGDTNYFATAADVATAISDAVGAIVIPSVTTSTAAQTVGVTASGHEVSVATATYTAATETGKIGEWTEATKGYLATGADVAAAIGDVNAKVDALHKTPQFKVVVVDDVTDLTKWQDYVTGGIQENYIYLVENIDAADGSYIEFIAYKNGETLVTERIGTTKTDLSGYAKSVKINGTTYTASAANAGALDLGTVVVGTYNSMASGTDAASQPNMESVYVSLSGGTMGIGIASATSSVMGLSKMFTGTLSTAASTVTDTAVSVKSAQAMYESLASLANSKVASVQESEYLNLAGLAVSGYTEVTINSRNINSFGSNSVINSGNVIGVKDCTLVDVNGIDYRIDTSVFAFDEDVDCVDFFGTNTKSRIEYWSGDMPNLKGSGYMFSGCSKLESFCGDLSSLTNGGYMFSACEALTSFCGDLSSLTNGEMMFSACYALTSFTSDLSSLTNGDSMFWGCKLDVESLECIAESLPTVTSGIIDIGASTNATEEVIATIKGKGWTVKSNANEI